MAAVVIVVGGGIGIAIVASGGDDDGAASSPTTFLEPVATPDATTETDPCPGTYDVLEATDIEDVVGVTVVETSFNEDGQVCIFDFEGSNSLVYATGHYDGEDAAIREVAEERAKAPDAEDVPGLGDEAHFSATREVLEARSGVLTINISYGGPDVTRDEVVSLAEIFFERNGE